jgi:hypothetical protein
MYLEDLDDDDKECSIFNGEDLLMLRFSNTKSSMLYKLVSVGKADWIVFNLMIYNRKQQFKVQVRKTQNTLHIALLPLPSPSLHLPSPPPL